MAVRIRLKKLGRRHRPFFRLCAVDARRPRDGKVIEELGHYDPMVRETDARAILNGERINYWLSVGALPSEKVKVLIKKYGSNGTHLEQQRLALERLKIVAQTPPPVPIPRPAPKAEPESKPETEAEPPVGDAAQAQAAEAEAVAEPSASGEEPATTNETK